MLPKHLVFQYINMVSKIRCAVIGGANGTPSGILGTQKTEPSVDQQPDKPSIIQTPGSKI
jgi:hypothetical protein